MPVYCDVDDLTELEELRARLAGIMTFDFMPSFGLVFRDQFRVMAKQRYAVFAQHEHSAGIIKLERPCRTETSKKVTDLSQPPF